MATIQELLFDNFFFLSFFTSQTALWFYYDVSAQFYTLLELGGYMVEMDTSA